MPNNPISQISLNDGTGNPTTYDIKDAFARQHIVPTFVGTSAEIRTAEQQGLITEGMLVYCTDDSTSGVSVNASDVNYDNTESGLIADDVQDAIDEVKSALPNVKSGTNAVTFSSGQGTLTHNCAFTNTNYIVMAHVRFDNQPTGRAYIGNIYNINGNSSQIQLDNGNHQGWTGNVDIDWIAIPIQ